MRSSYCQVSGNGTILIVIDGQSYIIPKTHHKYKEILRLIYYKDRLSIVLENSSMKVFQISAQKKEQILFLLKQENSNG
jgi:hypothetical protein